MSEKKFRGRFITSYPMGFDTFTEMVVPTLSRERFPTWTIRRLKNGARNWFASVTRHKPELWEEDDMTLNRVQSYLGSPAREAFALWLKEAQVKGKEK